MERFAAYWGSRGAPLIEGRIAGYLLLDDSGGVSAEELSAVLGASRGSVSTYTRRLVDAGFVQRVRREGERTHYFVMDLDVWGGFLRAEQDYLRDQRTLAERALAVVPERGRAHERLRNMRDYMGWIVEEGVLPERWEAFKAARDAAG